MSKLIDSAPETATVTVSGRGRDPCRRGGRGRYGEHSAGQKIPVDGEVTEGISAVDESAITGGVSP